MCDSRSTTYFYLYVCVAATGDADLQYLVGHNSVSVVTSEGGTRLDDVDAGFGTRDFRVILGLTLESGGCRFNGVELSTG